MTDTEIVPVEELSFEKALAELETIVQRLEQGDVDLEESIAIYERGELLKKHCERLLKEAEGRVEKIRLGGEGKPEAIQPLDGDDDPF
jgi:exodeoxyribonuclease VII small subunit